MSSPLLRSAFVIAIMTICAAAAAAGALACGGERAGGASAGAPVSPPSAHPSPDPRPAVPLSINKPDAGDGTDASADGGP